MKYLDLIEVLSFFETMSFDDSQWFQFKSAENLDVCVKYTKSEPRSWSVWFSMSEDASKQTCSKLHLISILEAFKVEMDDFSSKIKETILFQASYAALFIEECKFLYGRQAVEDSVTQTQEFMRVLSNSVKSAFEPSRDGIISNDLGKVVSIKHEQGVINSAEGPVYVAKPLLKIVKNEKKIPRS